MGADASAAPAPGELGVVVVTGAAKGIGAATVDRLAARGFRVVAGVRSHADATVLAGRYPAGQVRPVRLDVTDPTQIEQAAADVREEVGDGRLAGLVNNAGLAVAAPLEFLPPAELRRQLDVNVVGQLATLQPLIPMLRRGRGRVVTIGSIGGRIAGPMTGAYHASKFGIRGLTDSLRLELRPFGVPVVLVEPGAVATPIWATSIAAADALLATLPRRVDQLYGPVMAAVRADAERSATAGIPAEDVAEVIEKALTARRPRHRYLVGRDAHLAALIARLPDRLQGRLVLAQYRGRTVAAADPAAEAGAAGGFSSDRS